MNSDNRKEQSDEKILHLDEAERLPRASYELPAVPNSSQAAEVVKQIIEQILVNERRRARIEFVQVSIFSLVFLFAILGTGIWFARQLLVQLREERQQTWRMMAGGGDSGMAVYSADKTIMWPDQTDVKTPPALNREEVAKLEQNINNLSELLKTKPQSASASVRDMLQNQQNAIQSLSARLNEAQVNTDATPKETKQVGSTGGGPRFAGALRSGESASGGFIAVPLAEDLNLRMPIPSL